MPNLGIIMLIMGITMIDQKLSTFLFSKTRRGLLALLYGHPDEAFYINQLMQSTGSGSGAVQRELKLMTEAGIISRDVQGRQVYFRANKNCPIYMELKSIVTKTFGMADILCEELAPLAKKIATAFVYGSIAKGEATDSSDIDLAVVGTVDEMALHKKIARAENRLARQVNYTLLTQHEFRKRRNETGGFMARVLSGPKIMILGFNDEL